MGRQAHREQAMRTILKRHLTHAKPALYPQPDAGVTLARIADFW
jgi:hypothetical protein